MISFKSRSHSDNDRRAGRTVEARLQQLERSRRRGQAAGAVLGAGCLALVLLAVSPPRHTEPSVESHEYVLRDDAGTRRGEWTTRGDGAPKLWLYDEQGARRIEIGLLTDGSAGVRLLDGRERIRAVLGMADGEPSVSLRDPDGRDRAKLVLLSNGEPALFLWDRAGNTVWSSPALSSRR